MTTKLYTEKKAVASEAVQAEFKPEQLYIENATQNLNRMDLEIMSKNAIRWNSKAAARLALVILIQGLSK